MKYNEVIDNLQNLTLSKVNTTELAQILNMPVRTLYTRSYRNSEVTPLELKKIEDFYNVNLFKSDTHKNNITSFPTADRIEINYWEQLPDELKNPKIISCWFDREIIENAWGMSAEHLCIVPMVGDKMSHYWYPIRNGDILIVDMQQDHIMGNGVYFGTSQNNTRFWVREMQILMNQEIEFSGYAPSGETKKIYTTLDLEKVDFKLIGKVIKNVSFRL